MRPLVLRLVRVICMHHGMPGIAQQLLQTQAAVADDPVVEPVELPIRPRCPDVVRHGLGKFTQLQLAGVHRRFGLNARRDVGTFDKDAHHLACPARRDGPPTAYKLG